MYISNIYYFLNMKQKMTKKENLNRQINKAIATTVVVTAIGLSTTINSLPVRASVRLERNGKPEVYSTSRALYQNSTEESEGEILDMENLVTNLLKEGRYREARQIRRTFLKDVNPLKQELRKLQNYAVRIN